MIHDVTFRDFQEKKGIKHEKYSNNINVVKNVFAARIYVVS